MPKWRPHADHIPWGLCHQCPCPHSEPQLTHCLPRRPSRPAGRSIPGSCGVTSLCWVPVHTKSCVCSPGVESLVSPSRVELLHSIPAGLESQELWGLLLLRPDPQAGEPDVGLRILTPVGEPLPYNYFPVCWSPTWRVWNLIIL